MSEIHVNLLQTFVPCHPIKDKLRDLLGQSYLSDIVNRLVGLKLCLDRYSWGAGKLGSECSSWFI